MTGIAAIAAERERQKVEEGWSPAHDDGHRPGVLACAGGAYAFAAFHDAHIREDGTPVGWPFDVAWYKPRDARSMLVKAGALIAAEIDRIDRAALKKEQDDAKP